MPSVARPQPPRPAARPTLVSMARMLGLSRSTVSDILNGNDRYAEETRRRVLELAESLHYQPNRSAQATRRGRSRLIGVLHASGTLQVVNERALWLGRAIAETGYELLLSDLQWHSSSSVLALVRHMIASRIEGFIFSGGIPFDDRESHTLLHLIAEAGIPAVLISAPHLPGIPAVNADFETGFYDLTRHVIGTGRRRLTLLLSAHPESWWHGVSRHRGFCRAIQAAGGSVSEPLPISAYRQPRWRDDDSLQGEVLFYDGEPGGLYQPFTPSQMAMGHLLDHRFGTQGLIVTNDEWAFGAISVCLQRGIDLPRAFAVTGFDDSALATAGPLPITSASQQSEETCRVVVQELMQRMAGESSGSRDLLIPCPVVVRESTRRFS